MTVWCMVNDSVVSDAVVQIFWLRPEWHNQQAVLTGVVRVGKTTYKNGRQNGACSCQVLSRCTQELF